MPAEGGPLEPLTGAENMALDELLLLRVRDTGRPVLRLYRWEPACLSLGRNQPARGLLDPAAAATRGLDIVRRPTGGLAVLHDREITYCAALPVGLLGSPRATYHALNRALAQGLRRLGVPAGVVRARAPAPAPRASLPSSGYLGAATREARCFGAALPGELAVEGRKLVGSAQRREGRVLLQHGSVLLDGDQGVVAELFHHAPPGFDGSRVPPTTLAEILGAPPAAERVIDAILEGVQATIGIRLAGTALSPGEAERLPELVERYRSREWTWRR